ncbi:MAG TPA: hypothetical protein VKZ88_06760, partial [Fibrobacteria bacterium]|nr:hypothetical protein [Fibrobacteria bacterium]
MKGFVSLSSFSLKGPVFRDPHPPGVRRPGSGSKTPARQQAKKKETNVSGLFQAGFEKGCTSGTKRCSY